MATKFCRRCGSALLDGDRFCGECGALIPGMAADPDEPTQAADVLGEDRAEDFFAEWENVEPLGPLPEDPGDLPTRGPEGRSGDHLPDAGVPVQASPDQSPTEAIPTARAGDTAVMPQVPAEPYMAPGAPRPTGPRPGPALAPPPPGPPAYQAGPARPPSKGFPIGATFALLGAVAVLVSALLPWATGDLTRTVEPRDLPFRLLLEPGGPGTGPSLGLVVLGLGLLGALVALLTMVAPAVKFLRRIVGLVTLAAPGLFVWRLVQGLLEAGGIDQLMSTVGPGLYVVTAGALTQIVSGRWFRR